MSSVVDGATNNSGLSADAEFVGQLERSTAAWTDLGFTLFAFQRGGNGLRAQGAVVVGVVRGRLT